MKNRTILFAIFLFSVTSFNPLFSQQVGDDIDGEATGDQSGSSISLSLDGNRLAIGAPFNDGNGADAGHVRVYKLVGGIWSQVGDDINGEAAGDQSGFSVSLSSDGNRVAIGAIKNDGSGSNAGHVRVYDWNNFTWIKMGADIDGEAAGDESGRTVSLSADGNRLAIGTPFNDENGNNVGNVRVYDWDESSWVQVGADIEGEAVDDKFSWHISLSSDGNRLASGTPFNNGNGSNAGHVRIYDWDGSNWAQVGTDIDGEAVEDRSGNVSLSSDGSRVAIGGSWNDGNGSNAGHVRIFEWDGSIWTQVGVDIDGEAADDQSGYSVSLSSDGNRVAIGAITNGGNGSNAGHIRVYEWDGAAWVQVCDGDIEGEAVEDHFGWSVSLSSDGSLAAIGTPFNDGNGSNAGHVRVYECQITSALSPIVKSTFEVYPNPTSGKIEIPGVEYETLRIIDNLGRLQWETENPVSEIDISKLPNGVYFLLITLDNQLITKRIIKE